MTACQTCRSYLAKVGSERADVVAFTRRALTTEHPRDIARIGAAKAQLERTKALQAQHAAECVTP